MTSQIIPLLGVASPSYTPEPLRTIAINATFEGEQTSVYKEAVLMASALNRDAIVQFPLRDGKYSIRTFLASAIDDPDKNKVILLYGSPPEDKAVVFKSLEITSDLNVILDLSEAGGGIVDYPLLTGDGKLSGYFNLSTLPEDINYSDITIRAYYIDPLGGRFNGLQAAQVNCQSTGEWLIEGISGHHMYNVVISIPGYNDIIYSNTATSDDQFVGDPHWDRVVSLLHFDENFNDQTGLPWAVEGDAFIAPNSGIQGTGCYSGDGRNDYIKASSPSLILGGEDFTIEGFTHMLGSTYRGATFSNCLVDMRDSDPSANILLDIDNAGTLRLYFNGSYVIDNSSSVKLRVGLTHWALERHENNLMLFVDGVLAGTRTFSGTLNSDTVTLGGRYTVLTSDGDFRSVNGLIDEFRITKGVARYTENFTPPTEPFPNHGIL